MSTARPRRPGGKIAIVGMSGRFPGARDVDEFWHNLRNGVESITFASDEELRAVGVSEAQLRDPAYVRARSRMADADLFDAAFFNYTPREAEITDPQHRVFLECAWEALEDAGYCPEGYGGLIGVYAGAFTSTYLINHLRMSAALKGLVTGQQLSIGNHQDHLATRVAYKLDLRGPALSVQSACSTSLVAVAQACTALLNGQCDMALAGGVSVHFPETLGYRYQEGGIRSPDGHCRAFDARARGTVFGHGVGVVVLKRLEDALADGDHVHAVVLASAISNDGSQKVSYTAPGVVGQVLAIARALAQAGIDPATVTYIEAHGTATPLGDPIEISSLTQAFRARTQKKQYCAIGSVKTNIGHLDTAAGVAGLIKTTLALAHKELPPSLHYERPNPQIDFENSPFFVNAALTPWNAGKTPRRAGVSSFGIGGTNAHVILEEAPPAKAAAPSRPWQLLLVSARSHAALEQATARLARHLQTHSDLPLADVAYTLQVGRKAFGHRRVVICRDREEAIESLETPATRRVLSGVVAHKDPAVVFMFPGQGSQYVYMARDLYQQELVFREQIDRCAAILEPHLEIDIRTILYPAEDRAAAASEQLMQTAITQPALFVVEYALARLWMSWGVRPAAMIGHSIGEYVAACLAGVFSLEDALALVALRGRLIQELPGGAMLSVPLPEAELRPLLGERLSLAAVNGPALCVASGPIPEVEGLEARLAARDVEYRRLHTSHAFHSAMVDPILPGFAMQVARLRLQPPAVPYISNVTGSWISAAEATDPQYWSQHLRRGVRFADGLQSLAAEQSRLLLEVGPGQTLSTFARQQGAGRSIMQSLRHPQDRQHDLALLLQTLGRLWLAGVQPEWPAFYAGERRSRVPLPTYPFERQRYWVAPDSDGAPAAPAQPADRRQPRMEDWFYTPIWKGSVLPAPAAPHSQRRRWLVFLDPSGLGARLVERLRREDQEAITVAAGSVFSRDGAQAYTLPPGHREGYIALLKDLQERDAVPDTIAYLWSVTPDGDTMGDLARWRERLDLDFNGLVFLAQALGNRGITRPIHIAVISNNLQDVTGEESLCPEKALLLGPCKVIPQEYPNLSCSTVDVVLPSPGSRREDQLVEQLLSELSARSEDALVAYRGPHRWVQEYERLPLAEPQGLPRRLRQGGVYLITGGLGGIGLALAEYLAEAARARLVLVGRSSLPPRSEWAHWLAEHEPQDATCARLRALQRCEALGAELLVASADVVDQQQMREVIAQAHDRFGAIHGVVHAAGIAGGGVVQLKSPTVAEAVIAPKVQGTLVLDALLRDAELDFFLLCSSGTAIRGGFGQVDYCAANAFLDAFAHSRSVLPGTFTVSINWPAWREVGMAVNTQVPLDVKLRRERELAQRGISPIEGAEAFCRVLGSAAAQCIVSPVGFRRRAASSQTTVAAPASKPAEKPHPAAAHPRPVLDTPYVQPRNEMERTIVGIWQKLLGIEQVGVFDNFVDLGGHSLLATQLLSRLRDAFAVELPLASCFEAPTIAEMAQRVRAARESSAPVPQVPALVPVARERYRMHVSI